MFALRGHDRKALALHNARLRDMAEYTHALCPKYNGMCLK